MEERDGGPENGVLLTREEEDSLLLLEPLFARHLDRILDTLGLHLDSDPDRTSLLSDDRTVDQLKQAQQEYLLSLPNGNNGEIAGRNGAKTSQYPDPFGLGAGRHLRTILHFLISIQPLVFEAFRSRPHVHHRVWNALLKVIFRDLELEMSASLKRRDESIQAVRQQASEARGTLDLALHKQAAEEKQRQAEDWPAQHFQQQARAVDGRQQHLVFAWILNR